MKDLVTVFTPVYNRKNLIGNLYQSLLSQTYKNFEWIIVDDGSTDDIDEIIKSYQNEDRILIRFIKQENGGKHRAINNGVLHAKGELFYGEFYQFNLSSCIRQQNSLTAQFVSFSLSNLANIFYPPQFLQ